MVQNAKPDLPRSVAEQLDGLMKNAGQARLPGDGAAFLAFAGQACEAIPEPKTEWDFYPQTIARANVETIPGIAQCDALDPWLERMYQTHVDPERESVYTNLVAGHSLYLCGREAEAVALFKQVLQSQTPAVFKGEYRRYLDMAEKT